jgi:hypothetical protein
MTAYEPLSVKNIAAGLRRNSIDRDGNIHIGGMIIKGAPQLARFNPNFRDPRCGKPQSRGLT